MKSTLLLILLLPFLSIAQNPIFKEGIPNDISVEKVIFLKHESIKITADENGNKAEKYLYLRQENHNKILEEFNRELTIEALKYPYDYALASLSTYESLLPAGYKYILYSNAYKYDFLKKQPTEDELIVFEYYLYDVKNNLAYKVFELDEMKIYSSKLIIKRLKKALDVKN